MDFDVRGNFDILIRDVKLMSKLKTNVKNII